jgi:hypothetical protein
MHYAGMSPHPMLRDNRRHCADAYQNIARVGWRRSTGRSQPGARSGKRKAPGDHTGACWKVVMGRMDESENIFRTRSHARTRASNLLCGFSTTQVEVPIHDGCPCLASLRGCLRIFYASSNRPLIASQSFAFAGSFTTTLKSPSETHSASLR